MNMPKSHCRRQSGMNFGYVTVNGVNSNCFARRANNICEYMFALWGGMWYDESEVMNFAVICSDVMLERLLWDGGGIMIAFVHGMAVDMTESSVVVEAGGIGYEIYMTGADLSEIRMGEDVKVHTYFSVREDAMKLYGFRAKDDLQMFKLLLGVNGVGPKAALGVLAGITADELRFAILSDDVKTLSKAPGIGKKTAQKLILELKDKMKLEDAFELKLAHEQERAAVGAGEVSDGRQEAVEALVALGYSSADALRAVRKVTDVAPDDVEGLLKAALKNF